MTTFAGTVDEIRDQLAHDPQAVEDAVLLLAKDHVDNDGKDSDRGFLDFDEKIMMSYAWWLQQRGHFTSKQMEVARKKLIVRYAKRILRLVAADMSAPTVTVEHGSFPAPAAIDHSGLVYSGSISITPIGSESITVVPAVDVEFEPGGMIWTVVGTSAPKIGIERVEKLIKILKNSIVVFNFSYATEEEAIEAEAFVRRNTESKQFWGAFGGA